MYLKNTITSEIICRQMQHQFSQKFKPFSLWYNYYEKGQGDIMCILLCVSALWKPADILRRMRLRNCEISPSVNKSTRKEL